MSQPNTEFETPESQPSLSDPSHMRLSDAEELANAITHGAACAASLVAAGYVLLAFEFASPFRWYGFLAYSISLVLVFLCSTVSHIVREDESLRRARAWDQGAIYLLIAGTYTPGVIAFADGWVGYVLLTLIWSLAGFGFLSKVIGERKVNAVTTITYVLLGWVPAMVLGGCVPSIYFYWMLGGGLFYSAGVCFLLNDRKVRFFHVVWHLLVITAAAIHFYAICIVAI